MLPLCGVLLALFLISDGIQTGSGAKILAIFPFAGPSQYILVQPYLKTLAGRGHEVSVISAFPQKSPVRNFRDIPSMEILQHYDDLIKSSATNGQGDFMQYFRNVTLRTLENKNVQKLLHSKEEKFDLVIVETLQTDALYGFAEHFNASLIGISSYGTDPHIDGLVGNTSPLSCTPAVTSSFSDRMSFWERLQNLFMVVMEKLLVDLIHFPGQVELYKQYFPNAKKDLSELRKSFSLILLNQHFSLSFPRPYVPNMVEVGGFHVNHKPAALPKEMAEFIESSEHGVVYFSMGSNVKSKDLPADKRKVLLDTFASLKQKVMWKFEDTQLPGKPDNVFISQWFPQSDILAHPNVKLFITHGGLLSTIEALHHAVPVLGMPIFYDQFLNVERAKRAGYGLRVDLKDLSVEDLRLKIETLLTNASFSETAAQMSRRYHDQPIKPLDSAIYWTEYVLRHAGASHMRVTGQDMNFVEFHSLDTIAVLFGIPLLVLLVLVILGIKLVARQVSRKSNETTTKRKMQ